MYIYNMDKKCCLSIPSNIKYTVLQYMYVIKDVGGYVCVKYAELCN